MSGDPIDIAGKAIGNIMNWEALQMEHNASTEKMIAMLVANVGELQLAVKALNDVTKQHHTWIKEMQRGHLLASMHACDIRTHCARCGIKLDGKRHQLVTGWSAWICVTCANENKTANEIREEWD